MDAAACRWEPVAVEVVAAHVELLAQEGEARVQPVVQPRLQLDLHPDWILTLSVCQAARVARHKLPLPHQHPQVLDVVVPVAGEEPAEAAVAVVPRKVVHRQAVC